MIREPKFKIGQVLYIKDEVDYYVLLHNNKYDTYGNPRPHGITVVGILIEICEGGIQIFYKFSNINVSVPELVLLTEIPNLNKEEK